MILHILQSLHGVGSGSKEEKGDITDAAYHMIMRALQTGTPFVQKIFKIGYCIRGNCTSDKYFLYK